jgi:hypothetical protein
MWSASSVMMHELSYSKICVQREKEGVKINLWIEVLSEPCVEDLHAWFCGGGVRKESLCIFHDKREVLPCVRLEKFLLISNLQQKGRWCVIEN